MNHGSLFSGIGGFDLAAEWMGWANKFHCEWNPFGQKVLKHYWPEAESYSDITKTDFSIWSGKIDILTGGFPCQPYSAAGKRLGKEDDRHLWPEMLRAIREIQPSWVVGENVRGLTNWNGGMVFDEVQADLETQGYEVTPFLLPACSVNAPHRRDRIWFVAYSKGNDHREQSGANNTRGKNERGRKTEIRIEPSRYGIQRITSNPSGSGCEWDKKPTKRCNNKREWISFNEPNSLYGSRFITNASSEGLERSSGKIKRWDNSGFTSYNKSGKWRYFPTQSLVCNGNDGVSSQLDGITFPKWRNESIKAGGNAIVPQVAFQIFKAIQEFQNNYGHKKDN